MTTRFNPKQYRDKQRLYVAVPGATSIQRLYAWDESKQEYRPPEGAKSYSARRWEIEGGKKVRKSKYFGSLPEARSWQTRTNPEQPGNPRGPLLSDVVADWKRVRYPSLARGTQVNYDKLLRLYFDSLLSVGVRDITPAVVDEWISGLIAKRNSFGKPSQRKAFRHELALLATVLNHYREYADDPEFSMPVRRRHRRDVKLRNRVAPVPKDLTETELKLFVAALKSARFGEQLSAMATLQYYQALRVSEAAGLHWEDVRFDWDNPRASRLFFTRHVCWIRGSRENSYIENGFKNSDAVGGMKEHPMLPAVFEALAPLWKAGATGLVFRNQSDVFFSYSQIQNSYNRAFEKAGLPYRSTHVMRHGGTRKTYDETGGDMEIAKQHLGNTDLASVQTYARRSAKAFSKYSDTQWDQAAAAGGGRKWPQMESHLKLVQENQEGEK